MNTVFSKNKGKRSRSSSNEDNNSFVKNVTARVTGFLPATITKWFSSPSTSNANGSTPAEEATDSSTEDEAAESPILTQPPSKRMRYSSPGKYNHFAPTDPNCVATNIDTIEQITPYSSVQSSPGRNTFRRETNYVATPVRAPNEDTGIERSDRDNTMFKSQHSVSNVGHSVAAKRKPIFDGPSYREASMRALRTTASNTMVDPKAPRFKPSLFGSPFYPGRTMYGGSSMYVNHPNIKQRKTALVKDSNSSDSTTMSNSAKRIMDLLENYSSPLMEAKRISQFMSNPKDETLNSTTVSGSPYANKVMSYKTQELHVPNIATILRLKQRSRLMDTTNAARQIIALHSSTMPDYIQSYSPTSAQKDTDKDSGSKLTTKVKTRLTRQNRGETIEMEEQLQPVNLPTAVLQIDKDNLPKFTSGKIPQSTVSSSTSNSTSNITFANSNLACLPVSGSNISVITMDSPQSNPETVFTNDSYKFSTPVRITSETHQISSTPPKFTFGSPERGIDKPKTDKKTVDDPSIVEGIPKVTEKILNSKSKDWQCPDCWVNNKTDVKNCVCCGAKQPTKESSKATKCTICKLADSQSNSEKCINCEKVQADNIMKMPVLQPVAASNWKCEDCWVSNDQNVNKCVCCGANNPRPVPTPSAKTSHAPILASIANIDWKCDDCWIKNKIDLDKCAACGAGRPGANQPNSLPTVMISSIFSSQDNSLSSIAKSQNVNSWECQSCLVRNQNIETKCACCGLNKPGAVKDINNQSFSFGITTNTSFKFGIDPKLQGSSIKMPEVKAPENKFNKPEESETNNNTLPKTPSFSFSVPAKKSDDEIDSAMKITDLPKVAGFTFALPKTIPKEQSASPIFGSTVKSANLDPEKTYLEKEKPQEVPKVDFKFSDNKQLAPLNYQENKDKPPAVSSALINQLACTEKKEAPADLNVPVAVTSTGLTPQKKFMFTGLGTTNMFAAPASTTSSFSNSVQSSPTATVSIIPKPEATIAPALYIFQKPDTATTSSIPLFQNKETITTTAPPPLTATAPVFSFGSSTVQSPPPPSFVNNSTPNKAPPTFGGNGIQSTAPPSFGGNGIQSAVSPSFGGNAQTAPPQTEKSKFNFTFGSNTPFNKTTFSASTDNNPNINKFGITSNSLSGNGLSNVNPMAGGNGLGSSKLGGPNELNKNPLNTGNEMASAPSLFGTPTKENLWSATNNNSVNPFVTSASTNPLQKPAAFTFGSSTPFNSNSTTPGFGNNPAPAQNVFGMNQNAGGQQPALFASPVQNQSTPNMFGVGAPQAVSNPAPAMNMFGTPNVGATPTFGTPNPSIPSFEAPSLTPAPAPAFNFGAPQPSGVFGFGQQPQQLQMPQQTGVYSFGAAGVSPQVQFNMGSAPNTPGARRVRKAVRRNPQR